MEPGAGAAAGFSDAEYQKNGAQLAADRGALLSSAQLILQVRVSGEAADIQNMKSGQIVIGHADPLTAGPALPALAKAGADRAGRGTDPADHARASHGRALQPGLSAFREFPVSAEQRGVTNANAMKRGQAAGA